MIRNLVRAYSQAHTARRLAQAPDSTAIRDQRSARQAVAVAKAGSQRTVVSDPSGKTEIPVSVSNRTFLSELAIRIASMANHRNVDIPSGVVDAINDSIVSNSNSPKILVTLKSNNPGRSGTRC